MMSGTSNQNYHVSALKTTTGDRHFTRHNEGLPCLRTSHRSC